MPVDMDSRFRGNDDYFRAKQKGRGFCRALSHYSDP